jgi:hypothetical protein
MIEPTLEEFADRPLANRSMYAIADLGHESSEGSLGFALGSLDCAMRVPLAASQGVAAGMNAELPGATSPLPHGTSHGLYRATDGQTDGQIASVGDCRPLAAV